MGLFNYVTTKAGCPNCHFLIEEWQSKMLVDKLGYDLLDCMMKVKLEDIKSGEAHAICDNCHRSVEYDIRNGKLVKPRAEKVISPC